MQDPGASPRSRVFLCHDSYDKAAVRQLYNRLTADGLDAWMDEADLIGGDEWDRKIRATLREARCVLICLSRHSFAKAGYYQKEIRFALDAADEQPPGRRYLIPVRLNECEVPGNLSHLHYVDLFAEGGYEALKKAISEIDADPVALSRRPDGKKREPSFLSRWRWQIGFAAALVCVGSAAGWWRHHQRSSFSRWAAQTAEVLLQEHPEVHDLPLLLSDMAAASSWSADAREAMLRSTVAAGRIQTGQRACCRVAFSHDGKALATAGQDGTVNIWRMEDRTLSRPAIQFTPAADVRAIAFNSDATQLVIAGANGKAEIWDPKSASTSPLMTLSPSHGDTIMDAKFRLQGEQSGNELLATASFDGVVRLWDTSTGHFIRDLPVMSGAIVAIDFNSAGSRLAVAAKNGDVLVWDTSSHASVRQFPARAVADDSLAGIAFSPGGELLATASELGYLRFWDSQDGHLVSELPRSGNIVFRTVRFRPKVKQQLVTIDADNNIRQWRDDGSSTTLWVPPDTVKLTGAAFTPDGTKLAVGDVNGYVSIYYLNDADLQSLSSSLLDRTAAAGQCAVYLEKKTCAALALPAAPANP